MANPDFSITPNSICFYGHHSGRITIGASLTGWHLLAPLLTLANTRRAYDDKLGFEPFQTDADGLRSLVTYSAQAEESVASAVEIIGTLLAYTQVEELPPQSFREIGWLLSGLSVIRGELVALREDAGHHLKRDGHGAAEGI